MYIDVIVKRHPNMYRRKEELRGTRLELQILVVFLNHLLCSVKRVPKNNDTQ